MTFLSSDPPDRIAIPKTSGALWVEHLLWVFMLSFALDYRASEVREGAAGTGIDQLVFLALCGGSTLGIIAIGWRFLIVRPGAWMIAFWGFFVAFMLGNAFLQGVNPGRSIRITLPLALCLAGMVNAHIAGCSGIRPSHIVRPVLVAACTNILWRITQGFLFKEITLDTVRTEVQSSASNWVAAWIGCALLLRGRFHWSLLAATGVLFIGIFITVTRSLLFPVFASAVASGICFLLAILWGQARWTDLTKRLLPVGALAALALGGLGIAAVAQPGLLERWNERLFHHAADRNIVSDISYLTRRAEADAITNILAADPIHFLHGRGIGASYYWDAAYLPEIYMVYPKGIDIGSDVWFGGHSVWTYALFSGGAIALFSYIALIIATMVFSLKAARANASDPGPDQWLAFLPFIAATCLLSETLTSNPFDERLAGLIFGVMAGLSQSSMVRASWVHVARQPRPAPVS